MDWFQNEWLSKAAWSLGVLLVVVLVGKGVNRALHSVITETARFYKARKTVYYVLTALYLIWLVTFWVSVAETFMTYIGLLSAGIAISLKDVFTNIVAWFFIVLRRPFSVGDRISINGHIGDVIDVRLFQFSLIEVSDATEGAQSTGSIVDIPNHFVFTHPMVNDVKGFQFIWNEITVVLTLDSDWEASKEQFLAIVNRHTIRYTEEAAQEVRQAARKYLIYYHNFNPIVYTDVAKGGVVLTMRYLCAPKDKRTTRHMILEDVLRWVATTPTVHIVAS